jgi:Pyruvate/2-oxoacid:ferredoxin oxidoreductase gamma subunit
MHKEMIIAGAGGQGVLLTGSLALGEEPQAMNSYVRRLLSGEEAEQDYA